MSFANDLDAKFFQALLNGLIKRTFFGDQTFTNELLQEQLFSSDASSAAAVIQVCEHTLKEAAFQGWEVRHLDKHLSSTDISAEHKHVFLHVWKSQDAEIHSSIVEQSKWGGNATLASLQWRIDIKSTAKGGEELNEPTAILQLGLTNTEEEKQVSTVTFEMNRDEVNDAVTQLRVIERAIGASATAKPAGGGAATAAEEKS